MPFHQSNKPVDVYIVVQALNGVNTVNTHAFVSLLVIYLFIFVMSTKSAVAQVFYRIRFLSY